jgi:hypothetical protein
MGTTWRAYSSGNDLIPGKWVAGYRGLGVLAETVPSSGTSGPGILFPSLIFPADTGVEVRAELITAPPSGVLQLFDDSSATYNNPTPGVYPAVFKYWRAGADQGNATVEFIIGESTTLQSNTNLSFLGAAGAGVSISTALSGSIRPMSFLGSAGAVVSISTALSGSIRPMSFLGSAGAPGTASAASFSGQAGLVFSGAAGVLTNSNIHRCVVVASQPLAAAPNLTPSSGTWVGNWIGSGTTWSRDLKIADDDPKGAQYFTASAVGLSGLVGTSITTGGTYFVGGFAPRVITFPALARYHAIGTTVVDITKVSVTYAGSTVLTRRSDTNDAFQSFTIVNSSGVYDPLGGYLFISDLAFSQMNTSGTLQLIISEAV